MVGKVAETNTRTNITISKELKKNLEELAKKENRSFNNLIITVLMRYVQEKGVN